MEVNNKAMKNEAIKKKETNDDDLDYNKDGHVIKGKTNSTIDLGSQRDSDWSSTVKFKMSENSEVKNTVVTRDDAVGNKIVVQETLEDKRCQEEFNKWYWKQERLKEERKQAVTVKVLMKRDMENDALKNESNGKNEGKKLVSKCVGTSDGLVNEPFTKYAFEMCHDNNYSKEVVTDSESILQEDYARGVKNMDAKDEVSIAANVKSHCHEDDLDDEGHANKVKIDDLKGKRRRKAKKVRKVKNKVPNDDTSDEDVSDLDAEVMEKGSEASFSTANGKGEFDDSNFGAEVVANMTKAIEDALDTAKGRLADKQEEKRRNTKDGSKFSPSCFKLLQQI